MMRSSCSCLAAVSTVTASAIAMVLAAGTAPADTDWSSAAATWYADPHGPGSGGGACGYGTSVTEPPLNFMVAAANPALYQSGKGCGATYEIVCTDNTECSGNPITVVITDECVGGPCATDAVHFDLSGTAFGALAKAGRADQLRNAATLQVQYRRVPATSTDDLRYHADDCDSRALRLTMSVARRSVLTCPVSAQVHQHFYTDAHNATYYQRDVIGDMAVSQDLPRPAE